ncbi:hypothetical protein LCGC14_0909600 [marine sediment metagenome]|uniref:DOD-type homing endonuclease domain-containing protein n=1 Tax=marine sediment metagenome TaxID=412755 RepID=A0A0F9NYQ3_9ZZZZ
MKISEAYVFGRWLGDGTKESSSLEIARSESRIDEMETIANMIHKPFCHTNSSCTRFQDAYKLKKEFYRIYSIIINQDVKLLFNIKESFAIIAGFLESDGSIDNHSKNKIKIVLHNNDKNLLYFLQNLLKNAGIICYIKESYGLKTNYGRDKCCRLHINNNLCLYYLFHMLLPYLLSKDKKNRINDWLKFYDDYHQSLKLNFSEKFISIEGEGRDMGRLKLFLRVRGCPFSCGYCDTKYSIGSRGMSNYKAPTLRQIINDVRNFGYFSEIEFTGGSPEWFPQKIGYLLVYFKIHFNSRITMQCSGGIYSEKNQALFTLSDINSFDCKDLREKVPFIIDKLYVREKDEIKFLVCDDLSYQFVKNKLKEFKDLKCQFIISVVTEENKDDLESLNLLIDKIKHDNDFPKQNVRLMVREHILLYGKGKRGI